MGTSIKLLKKRNLLIYDESEHFLDHLYQPFAWGDAFLRHVNRHPNDAIVHIWPLAETLILGMLDRRLPHCNHAIKMVRTHGYRAVVRNVGGLAVVADEGILNFSFIFSKMIDEKISITQAYELMYDFIILMFQQYKKEIRYFEISDSYCPGAYDLSIDGKKFAGIAQRRFKEGIMVSIYLSVCGNQQARGMLVKQFYEEGLQNEKVNFKFPNVNPNSMANLSELLDETLTVDSVKSLLYQMFEKMNISYMPIHVTDNMQEDFNKLYSKMIERNRKI